MARYLYFELSEFDCPGHQGSGKYVDPVLIRILDSMRNDCGFPFHVTSGYRTPEHNRAVGGKKSSDHLKKNDGYSHGVDIACDNSYERYAIISAALRRNITRIGIGKDFIHIGNWRENPQLVCWLY